MRLVAAAVVPILGLALAPAASAAPVSVHSFCDRDGCVATATFVAAPGENNDVTVVPLPRGRVAFHDAGAPVTGCADVDAHTTSCTLQKDTSLVMAIRLGDGDDIASVARADIDGGPGDDRITGDLGKLTGGPGADVLTAGPLGVTFVDGDGAQPAPDRYVGGTGAPSTLDYSGRRDDLRVDLRAGTAAEDVFSGNVNGVDGGAGDDVLIGTDGNDMLVGGLGSDRLIGLGGDDWIFTGINGFEDLRERPDRDVVDSGPGNDRIEITSVNRTGNLVDCGPGRDAVQSYASERADFLRACELVLFSTTSPRLRDHLRHLGDAFVISPTAGIYVARSGGRVVARGARSLRLNRRGRALLASRGRLKIAVRTHSGYDLVGFRMELTLAHEPQRM